MNTQVGMTAEESEKILNQTPTPKADPGLSALAAANKQIDSLVVSMSDNVTRQLTLLRDEIDDTIRAYEAHRDSLLDLNRKHRETGESALNIQTVVASAMRELQQRIADEGVAVNKLVNGQKDKSHA